MTLLRLLVVLGDFEAISQGLLLVRCEIGREGHCITIIVFSKWLVSVVLIVEIDQSLRCFGKLCYGANPFLLAV